MNDARLARQYNEINAAVFDLALPRASEIRIERSRRMKNINGNCRWSLTHGGTRIEHRIAINDDLVGAALSRTLLHEMVHLFNHVSGDLYESHGPKFRAAYVKYALRFDAVFTGCAVLDYATSQCHNLYAGKTAKRVRVAVEVRDGKVVAIAPKSKWELTCSAGCGFVGYRDRLAGVTKRATERDGVRHVRPDGSYCTCRLVAIKLR